MQTYYLYNYLIYPQKSGKKIIFLGFDKEI